MTPSHLQVVGYGEHARDPLELRQVVLDECPSRSHHQLHVSLGGAAAEQVRLHARIEQRLSVSSIGVDRLYNGFTDHGTDR